MSKTKSKAEKYTSKIRQEKIEKFTEKSRPEKIAKKKIRVRYHR